jgi:hypothetical protein
MKKMPKFITPPSTLMDNGYKKWIFEILSPLPSLPPTPSMDNGYKMDFRDWPPPPPMDNVQKLDFRNFTTAQNPHPSCIWDFWQFW